VGCDWFLGTLMASGCCGVNWPPRRGIMKADAGNGDARVDAEQGMSSDFSHHPV
jgi:hypothetical protein